MTEASYSCGFTELADESLTDHLLDVFTPEDARGNDGLIHNETTLLACWCGVTASTSGALDEHFLAVFTPPGRTGRDGKRHEISCAGG